MDIAERRWPHDQIDMRHARPQVAFVFLRHAAQHAHHEFGLVALADPQPSEPAPDLVLGVLPNRAGIEEDHVGFGFVGRRLVARIQQLAVNQLRVQLVHLTAVAVQVELPR